MKNYTEPVLLRQHPSQLLVVLTDLCETEQLLKLRAEQARQAEPERFAGKAPCVFFKFPYIPACEQFRELRRLILEIQSHTGLRACFRGIVALEASEWIGHEQEEYFTVVLKYLYDHREHWQSVLVLQDCSQGQLRRFLGRCAAFMTPRILDECLFSNENRLEEALRKSFEGRGATLCREAGKLLVSAMMSADCKRARSLTLIDRVAEDLLLQCGGRKEIAQRQVRKYLQNPHSILSILSGRVPLQEPWGEEHQEVLL